MLAKKPLLRLIEFRLRLNNQEEIVPSSGNHAIRDRARDVDVVAFFELERPEIGLDGAFAAVYKNQLVAIRVAVIERHRPPAAGNVEGHIRIAQERDRHPGGIVLIRRHKLI